MGKLPRKHVSITGALGDRLEKWCAANGDVPLSAVVEITAARAIGMRLDELPESVQRWASRVPVFDR